MMFLEGCELLRRLTETCDLYPYSENPTIGPYSEPDEIVTQLHTFPKIHFNIILRSTPIPPAWPIPLSFPSRDLYFPFSPCVLHAQPTYFSLI
jgi:hypothetical protein